MREPKNIDVYVENIDKSEEEMISAGVNKLIIDRVIRMRELYSFWVTNPRKSDQDIVSLCVEKYKLSKIRAYEDVHLCKLILGDLQQTNKDFARWKFDKLVFEAYDKAERESDTKSMVAAAAAYGKFHKLDKDDIRDNGYDMIVPQSFYPTDDPRRLGIKKIPHIMTSIKKLLKKYHDENIDALKIESEDYDKEMLLENIGSNKEGEYIESEEIGND